MNEFSNEKLDLITDQAYNGFHEETIKQHWDNIIGFDQLQPDETVRLVVMPSPTSNLAKSFSSGTGMITDKEQIRSARDLIDRMTMLQGTEVPGAIGYALSAGVYTYVKDKAPGYSSLKYIQNMSIDVDAHINAVTKDRFNLTIVKPDSLRYAAVSMLNYINTLLESNGLPFITPVYTAMTGGGYQFGVRFDKALDREGGKKVFEAFGSVLGFTHLNNSEKMQQEQDINNRALENNALVLENSASLGNSSNEFAASIREMPGADINQTADKNGFQHIKKKKGMTINVKSFTGEWFAPFFELDNSFKDVTHAQRVPGTINQKYSAFAYIDNLVSPDGYPEIIENLCQEAYRDLSIINEKDRTSVVNSYRKSYTNIHDQLYKVNPTGEYTRQPTEQIKALSGIVQFANSAERGLIGDYISLTEVEKQILSELSSREILREVLGDMGIEIVKDSSSYIACRSPFRTDSKPSLAVYVNGNRAVIKDFTEDLTYNIITLWMKVNTCNKSDAIEQMALKYSIKIDKTDKKEFSKLQTNETVIDLIKRVNTVDFVYYRLANASKNCTIKSVKTGNSKTFDGYKMLASHVLRFQLKIKNPDEEMRKAFEEAFLQYVIIDAFEDFLPGGDRVFEDDFIQYVNIWTASDSYKKCWEEAESLQPMNMDEALNLIREVCPTTYVFLLQITQKGDLKYFLNWLNALSKFQYLPIVPIFPSIEGAGKNLFANEVLAPYLNKCYITVANGQAMQSNFNSFMGYSNLIIADEGDFTGSREFDQLKLLTGNDTVRVEKKGVDAQTMARRFNVCMFTNGTEPVRHSITDRRCVYNKLEHTLEATLTKLGFKSIDEFKDKIAEEIHKFWGIIIKTKLHKPWINHNIKNGQYHYQILMMHPFGKLILKIIENKWDEISLQLNEKQKELQDEKTNMMLLQNIENAFFNGEALPLITINKYLDAMSWKSSSSIQEFINRNKLQNHGIEIMVDHDSIKIKLDAVKLQEFIFQENNLSELIPEFAVEKIKTLDELKAEMEKKRSKKTQTGIKVVNKYANVHNVTTEPFSGPGSESFGSAPKFDPSTMPNLPGGIK